MAKTGRPRKYKTAEELSAKVDAYFAECEEQDVYPDYAGLRLYLGLSQERIRVLQDPDTYPEEYISYVEIFSRARDRRESWLARKATSTPKVAQGCMMALKQSINGGWQDKPEAAGSQVSIYINGTDLAKVGG